MVNVAQVGTPGTVQSQLGSNTPSVTGVWSGTQPRTAGDILVASVGTWGGTTGGVPTTSTPGWSQRVVQQSSTLRVQVAIWTKVAAGADAAPVFTVTNTGTATNSRLTVELTEWSGADGSTPVVTTGTGDGAASPITITSAANVARSGSAGISQNVVGTSTVLTGTYTKGAAWTNIYNEGATSLRSHTAADYVLNPATGAVLSEICTWSGGTISDFTGVMIVIQPAAAGGTIMSVAGSAAASSSASGTFPPYLALRSAQCVTTGGGLSTLSVPSQPVAVGDLIFIWAASGFSSMTFTSDPADSLTAKTANSPVTSGWTSSQLFTKIADSTDVAKAAASGSYAITISTLHPWSAIIGVVPVSSTAHPFDPADDPGSGSTAGAVTTVTGASITTVNSPDLLVWLGAVKATSGNTPETMTPPVGYSVPAGVTQANSSGGGTSNVGVLLATIQDDTAGATGAVSGTIGTTQNTAGLLLAIKSVKVVPIPGIVAHIVSGAPTSSGFQVYARIRGATSCRLAYSTSSSMTSPSYIAAQAPDADGYVRFTVPGLAAATRYYVQLTDTPPGGSEVSIGTVGSCKTLPTAGSPANFTVALGACINAGAPAPALNVAIDDWVSWNADLNVFTGDFDYSGSTATDTVTQRKVYETQISGVPSLTGLISKTWGYYCRSDHEAGPDNGDSNNTYTAANIAAAQLIFPFGTLADTNTPPHGLYQSWVVGRIRFIMTDVRNIDRSPGGNTDDSSKTMLGAAQLAWLKTQLIQSEPLKVIITDPGWMGPPSIVNGPDKWWSYDTERQAIMSYIAANMSQVKNVMVWHGDTHCVGYAVSGDNSWGGFPVWCSAPIANDGGGRNLTNFTAYFNGGGGQTRAYARISFTDNGSTITALFQGWDATTGTAQVSRTETFTSGTTYAVAGSSVSSSAASGALGRSSPLSGLSDSTSLNKAYGDNLFTLRLGILPLLPVSLASVAAVYQINGSASAVSSAAGTVVQIGAVAGSSVTVSAASGSVSRFSPMAGQSATASQASGNVGLIVVIAGSSSTATTASGSLGTVSPASGTAATSSSATGAVVAQLAISGSSLTSSTASGSLSRVTPLSGSASTVSSASGAVVIQVGAVTYQVAGSSASQSSASGSIVQTMTVSGSSVSVSSASGSLGAVRPLVGSSSTLSSAAGLIVATLVISGSSPTVSAASGSLGRLSPVAGASTAVSSASGAVVIHVGAITYDVAGTALTQSAATGTVSLVAALAGTASSVSAATGALGLLRVLAGGAVSTSGATGSISLVGIVSGSATSASAAAGSIVLAGVVTGFASTPSRADAWLAGGPISALSVTASQASGAINQRLAISGASATVSQGSGALTTVGKPPLVISALAASVSTASGAVVTFMVLSGSASTASMAQGSLTSRGALSGVSVTASAGLGAIVLRGIVSGRADTLSRANGWISAKGGIAGIAINVSSADGWIGLPFIAGSLPDEITAIVWVSNVLTAAVSVDEITARATIETNEISAEVT